MINVLVTGAQGQLGMSIQKTSKNYPKLNFVFKDSKELDITNLVDIKGFFETKNFDYCINCAAYTNVDQAEKTPEVAFAVNADGAKKIAEVCHEHHVVLIHISTDYVFDGEKETPYTVNDKPHPINEYGKSKLLGEQYIQQILEQHYIVRSSWLYSEFGTNFYKTILKKAKSAEAIYVTDQQTGCPTNTNNLADYILEEIVLGNKEFGVYHFTDGEAMTWFDFAKKILKYNKLDQKVELVMDRNYCTFARRPRNSILE